MRTDQLERLVELEERVIDELIVELDPEHWSGAGKLPSEQSRDERGNRDWDKKGAARLLAIALRLRDLLNPAKNIPRGLDGAAPDPLTGEQERDDEGDALESDIARVERVASQIIDKVRTRERKHAKK